MTKRRAFGFVNAATFKRVAGRSIYEVELAAYLKGAGVPPWVEQYPFSKELGRRHRFDFAWPERMIAAEVDGGARLARWQTNPRTGRSQPVAVGRHGTRADYEKLNLASALGWQVFRFNPDMLRRPADLDLLRSVLLAKFP